MLDNAGGAASVVMEHPTARATPTPVPVARVLIVDGQPIVRHGIRTLLDAELDFAVIEAVAPDAAVALARRTRPDLIITDVEFGRSGIRTELVAALRDCSGPARLLIFTGCRDRDVMFRVLRLGVNGYLHKGADTAKVVHVLRTVLGGRGMFDAADVNDVDPFPEPNPTLRPDLAPGPVPTDEPGATTAEKIALLTSRELDVLKLIAHGMPSGEVGERLGITVATVKFHVRNIGAKLEVRRRPQLVFLAVRAGIV